MKPDEFKTEWRTSDVVALCSAMRQQADYSATPILADALQEAGCDAGELLAALRDGSADVRHRERWVAQVYSAETAAAVEWLDDLAARLGDSYGYGDDDSESPIQSMDYVVLMDNADESLATNGDHYLTQWGGEHWRITMYEVTYEAFWERYELATGKTVGDRGSSFFSCSC